MSTDYQAQLIPAVRKALGTHWEIRFDDHIVHIEHRRRGGTSFIPPNHPPGWHELLERMEYAFSLYQVRRDPPLPLRWGRETDFTISAVQAADPYLKDRKPHIFREGFIAQPVVRLTGKRDSHGQLADGFLTSFLNTSHVSRTSSTNDHAAKLDNFVGVLSTLGLHARHVTITGIVDTWQRGPVSGLTLHINHDRLPIGDCVMLWNTAAPERIVTDIGSGLERLRWALCRNDWQTMIHGPLASQADPDALDAIRTATVAIGHGILPTHRGPGSAIRRLLRAVPDQTLRLGVGAAVRHAHRYWTLVAPLHQSWADIAITIEEDRLRRVLHG